MKANLLGLTDIMKNFLKIKEYFLNLCMEN